MNHSVRFNPGDRTAEIKFESDGTMIFSKKLDMATLQALKAQIDDACLSNEIISYLENSGKYARDVADNAELINDMRSAYKNRKRDYEQLLGDICEAYEKRKNGRDVNAADIDTKILDEVASHFNYDLSRYEYREFVKDLIENATDYNDYALEDEDLMNDICEYYKANETTMTFDEIIGKFKKRLAKYEGNGINHDYDYDDNDDDENEKKGA